MSTPPKVPAKYSALTKLPTPEYARMKGGIDTTPSTARRLPLCTSLPRRKWSKMLVNRQPPSPQYEVSMASRAKELAT
ncbi:hypothetical protein D9M71_777690 [compost metagenome]